MRSHRTHETGDTPSAATRLKIIAGWLLILVLATATTLAAKKKAPAVSHDGLHLVPKTKVAAVYAKPDADLSGYDRVIILEPHVAFRKNWAEDQNRSSVFKVTKEDIAKIKQRTAELFLEVFVKELEARGGYPVVDSADSDVLLLRPAIIDLDVAAPDTGRAGGAHSLASSAGAATLFLELFDSVSGEILARVIDRKAATGGHVMRWTDETTNRLAAEQLLKGWARLLRDRLDELHDNEVQ